MIYLDNAATSYRKPETVYRAVEKALREYSGNPGRSGHRLSLEAGALVEEARRLLQQLLHADSPSEISFAWNATMALNEAIFGLAKPGMHIITSSLEHNSVSRPLEYLKQEMGAQITVLPASVEDGVSPDLLRAALRSDTGLVVISHISNVTGTINDLSALGAVCRQARVPFLVDASQSAGKYPVDVNEMGIDLLACPGHKGLLGPQGTGVLYVRSGILLRPLMHGGTGSHSENLLQPEQTPDRYESGTLNVPGIAGLAAGVRYIMEMGIDEIRQRECTLTKQLYDGLSSLPGVRMYAPEAEEKRGAVLSIRLEAYPPQEAAMILDSAFDIAVRSGLHCAPYAHRALGTLDQGGTIRFSPDLFNTSTEIDACISAVEQIIRSC